MIDQEYLRDSFDAVAPSYGAAVDEVGLWQSEHYVIDRYFHTDDSILDIGCGAGRTTFALYAEGYHQIIGMDLSTKMIELANAMATLKSMPITFLEGDCERIPFPNETYDVVMFSFNGLMQIPEHQHRARALKEMLRVVRPQGVAVFTTHDRDSGGEEFDEFWKQEQRTWAHGEQDARLFEFGDIFAIDPSVDEEYFIHIPDFNEIKTLILTCGGTVMETFMRSSRFNETAAVQDFSSDCRFWIVGKSSEGSSEV